MKIWIDAQLSPLPLPDGLTQFLTPKRLPRDLNLRGAEDEKIFLAAKKEHAVVMIKDSDFVLLLDYFGSPPKIIWLTCGNTSSASLKEILTKHLSQAIEFLERGEDLVEISD